MIDILFKKKLFLQILLWIGGVFFLTEFFFHFFGLSILEHDKIFLVTHDRYIAIFALICGAVLFLISTNIVKYNYLFIVVMVGVLMLMINAYFISYTGGYHRIFPQVTSLDQDLKILGVGVIIWYILTWVFWLRRNRNLT